MQNDQTNPEQQNELPALPTYIEQGSEAMPTPRAKTEKQSGSVELPQSSPSLPPPIPLTGDDISTPSSAAPPLSSATLQNVTTPQTSGLTADDNDLIEKEWIERAKAIVEKTKDDPHQQNKAINQVKADYVKKRYNKELKVSEG